MKRSLSIVLLLAVASCGGHLMAQQVFQFSQYLQNLYIINSATAGEHDYLDVNMSYRQQWVGINNAPTTYYISASMPLGKRLDLKPQVSSTRISTPSAYNTIKRKSFHALGGYLSQDSYGPYASSKVVLSYAFHLPVAENLTLSFSPNVAFNSMRFDQSKAVVELENDPSYNNYITNRSQSNQMDFNVGFWLYHPKYFVGYSTAQLLEDKLHLSNNVTMEQLKVHHKAMLGYRYRLSPRILLTPSTMIRAVSQSPISVDINLRMDYEDRYWAGVSYRNSNTISTMVGMYLNNTLKIGYSFDVSMSAIQTRNFGSHELFIGLNLLNKEKAVF